jgi:hypothetical protein
MPLSNDAKDENERRILLGIVEDAAASLKRAETKRNTYEDSQPMPFDSNDPRYAELNSEVKECRSVLETAQRTLQTALAAANGKPISGILSLIIRIGTQS